MKINVNFNTIVAASADAQLKAVSALKKQLAHEFENLNNKKSMKKLFKAWNSSASDALRAYESIPESVQRYWQDISAFKQKVEALPFHLYTQSPHASVREAMQPVVDEFINKEFAHQVGKVNINFWHDMMYMATFGGHITRDRPDAWHIAYEFNTAGRRKFAVPFNPAESLYEAGLWKQYADDIKGSNLTPKGEAVLQRLNERLGAPSKAAIYPHA